MLNDLQNISKNVYGFVLEGDGFFSYPSKFLEIDTLPSWNDLSSGRYTWRNNGIINIEHVSDKKQHQCKGYSDPITGPPTLSNTKVTKQSIDGSAKSSLIRSSTQSSFSNAISPNNSSIEEITSAAITPSSISAEDIALRKQGPAFHLKWLRSQTKKSKRSCANRNKRCDIKSVYRAPSSDPQIANAIVDKHNVLSLHDNTLSAPPSSSPSFSFSSRCESKIHAATYGDVRKLDDEESGEEVDGRHREEPKRRSEWRSSRGDEKIEEASFNEESISMPLDNAVGGEAYERVAKVNSMDEEMIEMNELSAEEGVEEKEWNEEKEGKQEKEEGEERQGSQREGDDIWGDKSEMENENGNENENGSEEVEDDDSIWDLFQCDSEADHDVKGNTGLDQESGALNHVHDKGESLAPDSAKRADVWLEECTLGEGRSNVDGETRNETAPLAEVEAVQGEMEGFEESDLLPESKTGREKSELPDEAEHEKGELKEGNYVDEMKSSKEGDSGKGAEGGQEIEEEEGEIEEGEIPKRRIEGSQTEKRQIKDKEIKQIQIKEANFFELITPPDLHHAVANHAFDYHPAPDPQIIASDQEEAGQESRGEEDLSLSSGRQGQKRKRGVRGGRKRRKSQQHQHLAVPSSSTYRLQTRGGDEANDGGKTEEGEVEEDGYGVLRDEGEMKKGLGGFGSGDRDRDSLGGRKGASDLCRNPSLQSPPPPPFNDSSFSPAILKRRVLDVQGEEVKTQEFFLGSQQGNKEVVGVGMDRGGPGSATTTEIGLYAELKAFERLLRRQRKQRGSKLGEGSDRNAGGLGKGKSKRRNNKEDNKEDNNTSSESIFEHSFNDHLSIHQIHLDLRLYGRQNHAAPYGSVIHRADVNLPLKVSERRQPLSLYDDGDSESTTYRGFNNNSSSNVSYNGTGMAVLPALPNRIRPGFRPAMEIQGPVPCVFWRLGRCAKGTACPFEHVGEPVTRLWMPCRFFQKYGSGACRFGAQACMYSHVPGLKAPCRTYIESGFCPLLRSSHSYFSNSNSNINNSSDTNDINTSGCPYSHPSPSEISADDLSLLRTHLQGRGGSGGDGQEGWVGHEKANHEKAGQAKPADSLNGADTPSFRGGAFSELGSGEDYGGEGSDDEDTLVQEDILGSKVSSYHLLSPHPPTSYPVASLPSGLQVEARGNRPSSCEPSNDWVTTMTSYQLPSKMLTALWERKMARRNTSLVFGQRV